MPISALVAIPPSGDHARTAWHGKAAIFAHPGEKKRIKNRAKRPQYFSPLYWYIKPVCHQQEINFFLQKKMEKQKNRKIKKSCLARKKSSRGKNTFRL